MHVGAPQSEQPGVGPVQHLMTSFAVSQGPHLMHCRSHGNFPGTAAATPWGDCDNSTSTLLSLPFPTTPTSPLILQVN